MKMRHLLREIGLPLSPVHVAERCRIRPTERGAVWQNLTGNRGAFLQKHKLASRLSAWVKIVKRKYCTCTFTYRTELWHTDCPITIKTSVVYEGAPPGWSSRATGRKRTGPDLRCTALLPLIRQTPSHSPPSNTRSEQRSSSSLACGAACSS